MALEDWLLTAEERGNPHTRIDARHGDGTAWSEGNRARAVVHGKPYFAELHRILGELGTGDRFYFVDWRGDPDEKLTDDPGSTLAETLVAAAKRGVDVRGLLWRSHHQRFGFSSQGHRELGALLEEAGGEVLRDMRVRTRGAHHQKLVVVRYAGQPERDIAYVGGIDLCWSRRDDIDHQGDEQREDLAAAYGPTPPWHDVQIAVQGPAVHDVETTFRERWEDSTPLTTNPGRLLSSLVQREDLVADPLGEQWPPPPPVEGGNDVVQVLRTFPVILPKGYDFAPDGERSVMAGNTKAIANAERLVYVEDQYLWSEDVGKHFAGALRDHPDLRLIIVLPLVPDQDGEVAQVPQLHGRALAMDLIMEAGGDRVAVFGLSNEEGLPIYVHAKTCIIDHRWVSIGSDNLNRRSWTSDSEIAISVVDPRCLDADAAPADSFPRRLLRELAAEHLGCEPDEVPEDPHELFDAMVACAERLDAWYDAGAPDPQTGVRGWVSSHVPHPSRKHHLRGSKRLQVKARRDAYAVTDRATATGGRPPGRLRRLAVPELSRAQRLWAPRLYETLFDPDGRV